MKFDLLFKRAANINQHKKRHEEDVEQFDHSASVEQAEEETNDHDMDYYQHEDMNQLLRSKKYREKLTNVDVKLMTRPGVCTAEGVVVFTVVEERDDVHMSTTYFIDNIIEFKDVEVYNVPNPKKNKINITENLSPEEMEVVENTLEKQLDKGLSSWNK